MSNNNGVKMTTRYFDITNIVWPEETPDKYKEPFELITLDEDMRQENGHTVEEAIYDIIEESYVRHRPISLQFRETTEDEYIDILVSMRGLPEDERPTIEEQQAKAKRMKDFRRKLRSQGITVG
jgi:hypothetical protein